MKNFILCFAVSLLLATSCVAQAPRGPFADVPTGPWIYQDATALQEAGILLDDPYRGGSHRPMTWHEAAMKIAALLSQLSGSPSHGRTDTETRLLASPSAVSALQDLVIHFKPELQVLNVDVDAVQLRLAEMARTAILPLAAKPFSDVPATHWAASSVEVLRLHGIVAGYPNAAYAIPEGKR